jgi:predicted outer membrane repeat protein
MAIKCDKINVVLPTVSCGKKCRNQKIVVLHQNICSLKVKTRKLEVLLCLTEHWLSNNKLNCINTADFKLVSAFCRSSSEHGGSGIYVKDDLDTKGISCFTHISEEKVFGMSLIEFLNINYL